MRRLSGGLLLIAAALAAAPVATVGATFHGTPANVDVSQRHLNESEESIAVNPTNPKNIVIVTNVGHREAGLTAGMFEGVSFDGGRTWSTKLIGNNDNLGDACCDPSLSFDQFGNLFLAYLFEVENTVPIALSTDGGLNFRLVGNIVAPAGGTPTKSSGDNRGLVRLHPAAARSFCRRGTRPGVGPDRRPAQRPRVSHLHPGTEEREQQHRHL